MNRKKIRKPDRKKVPAPTSKELLVLTGLELPAPARGRQPGAVHEGSGAEIRAVEPEEPETGEEAHKSGTMILTGLRLEAEDGSGRRLELARCMDQYGNGAFFVNSNASRRSSRTAYCPHCRRSHWALSFVDAVRDGWDVLSEDNDCCLSPETLISGVVELLRKKADPAKAATS